MLLNKKPISFYYGEEDQGQINIAFQQLMSLLIPTLIAYIVLFCAGLFVSGIIVFFLMGYAGLGIATYYEVSEIRSHKTLTRLAAVSSTPMMTIKLFFPTGIWPVGFIFFVFFMFLYIRAIRINGPERDAS